eukprot:TRINITY_DN3984_c0_g1_i1.p1 TRINITY_DN3984_c0_g1~~TRINITY_DN3984_c0_g1_i1.p1  ORF type:complete len:507 (-),score=185.45 TRINITY_DN3984_c0_g1_i1:85-1605(-)
MSNAAARPKKAKAKARGKAGGKKSTRVIYTAKAAMTYALGSASVAEGDPLFLLNEHQETWYAECNGNVLLIPKQAVGDIKPVDPRQAFVAVAVFSYTPEGDGMEHVLPIFAGEDLYILNSESGWWFGVLANEKLEGKKAGYVPSTYLERRATSNTRQMVQQLRHATIRSAAGGAAKRGPKPVWERGGRNRDLARALRRADAAERKASLVVSEMERREQEMLQRQAELEKKLVQLEEKLSSGEITRKPREERSESAGEATARALREKEAAKARKEKSAGADPGSRFDKKHKLVSAAGGTAVAGAAPESESAAAVEEGADSDFEFMSLATVQREREESKAGEPVEAAVPGVAVEEEQEESGTSETRNEGTLRKAKYKRVSRMRAKTDDTPATKLLSVGEGLVKAQSERQFEHEEEEEEDDESEYGAEIESDEDEDSDDSEEDEGMSPHDKDMNDLLDEFDDLVELEEHRGRHRKRAFSSLFDRDGALDRFLAWKKRAEEAGRQHSQAK